MSGSTSRPDLGPSGQQTDQPLNACAASPGCQAPMALPASPGKAAFRVTPDFPCPRATGFSAPPFPEASQPSPMVTERYDDPHWAKENTGGFRGHRGRDTHKARVHVLSTAYWAALPTPPPTSWN